MNEREKFEKWARDNSIPIKDIKGAAFTHLGHISLMAYKAAFSTNKEEIDALKAKNTALQELLDLCEGTLDSRNRNIGDILGVNRALKADNEKLRKDAERWQYGLTYGFPICFQAGWRSPLPSGRLTGGKPFSCANEAIYAAMTAPDTKGE